MLKIFLHIDGGPEREDLNEILKLFIITNDTVTGESILRERTPDEQWGRTFKLSFNGDLISLEEVLPTQKESKEDFESLLEAQGLPKLEQVTKPGSANDSTTQGSKKLSQSKVIFDESIRKMGREHLSLNIPRLDSPDVTIVRNPERILDLLEKFHDDPLVPSEESLFAQVFTGRSREDMVFLSSNLIAKVPMELMEGRYVPLEAREGQVIQLYFFDESNSEKFELVFGFIHKRHKRGKEFDLELIIPAGDTQFSVDLISATTNSSIGMPLTGFRVRVEGGACETTNAYLTGCLREELEYMGVHHRSKPLEIHQRNEILQMPDGRLMALAVLADDENVEFKTHFEILGFDPGPDITYTEWKQDDDAEIPAERIVSSHWVTIHESDAPDAKKVKRLAIRARNNTPLFYIVDEELETFLEKLKNKQVPHFLTLAVSNQGEVFFINRAQEMANFLFDKNVRTFRNEGRKFSGFVGREPKSVAKIDLLKINPDGSQTFRVRAALGQSISISRRSLEFQSRHAELEYEFTVYHTIMA